MSVNGLFCSKLNCVTEQLQLLTAAKVHSTDGALSVQANVSPINYLAGYMLHCMGCTSYVLDEVDKEVEELLKQLKYDLRGYKKRRVAPP